MNLVKYILNCILLESERDSALSKGVVLDNIVAFLTYGFVVTVFILSDLFLRMKTKLDTWIRYLCACGITAIILVQVGATIIGVEELVNLAKGV